MKFTAKQIADLLSGTIEGNPDVEVSKLSKIEEGTVGSLTFLSNLKYTPFIYTTKASLVIVNKNFIQEKPLNSTLIRVADAYKAFASLLQMYNEVKLNKQGREEPYFVSKSAIIGKNEYIGAFSYIGQNVSIGKNCKIYPHTYIGDNVIIGDDCTLFSGVKIYSESTIGNNCTFHSGSIIGADGFGFTPDENGAFQKVPQIGNVIIENHVDVGSGTTIDRATMGSTIIRNGVKLDNLIQIGHNVEIGQHTVIAAQTGVAGSTKIGRHCMIGGQVGFAGHLTIGDHVKIQGKSGITKSLASNQSVQGNPAFAYKKYNKSLVHFKNLPFIVATLDSLVKQKTAKNE